MTRPIGPHLVRTGGRGCPKGQFLAPWDVEHVIEKVISTSGAAEGNTQGPVIDRNVGASPQLGSLGLLGSLGYFEQTQKTQQTQETQQTQQTQETERSETHKKPKKPNKGKGL